MNNCGNMNEECMPEDEEPMDEEEEEDEDIQ